MNPEKEITWKDIGGLVLLVICWCVSAIIAHLYAPPTIPVIMLLLGAAAICVIWVERQDGIQHPLLVLGYLMAAAGVVTAVAIVVSWSRDGLIPFPAFLLTLFGVVVAVYVFSSRWIRPKDR